MVKWNRNLPQRNTKPRLERRVLRSLALVGVLGFAGHLRAEPRISTLHQVSVLDRFRAQNPQNPEDGMPDPDAEISALSAQEDKLKDNFTTIPRSKLMSLQVATVVGWGVFFLLWMVGRSRRNLEHLDPPRD